MTRVLLLHGFPQTSAAWRHVTPALERAGHPVVTPDLWGADLERQALVAIGDEPVHLVGHDVGAIAAWRIAAAHPERVRTLTAVSAPHPEAFRRALDGEGGSDQAQRSFYLDHFAQPQALDLFTADDGAGLRRLFAASNHTGDVEPHVAAMKDRATLDAALGWYRAAPPAEVAKVTVPTLYVWGADDTVIGPHAAAFTAEHVTGPYRFEALDGVGHWVPELAPDRLAPLVLEHLG